LLGDQISSAIAVWLPLRSLVNLALTTNRFVHRRRSTTLSRCASSLRTFKVSRNASLKVSGYWQMKQWQILGRAKLDAEAPRTSTSRRHRAPIRYPHHQQSKSPTECTKSPRGRTRCFHPFDAAIGRTERGPSQMPQHSCPFF
jgi:hypothetical protein